MGSERDPKVHALKKKNLTAAFSTRALGEQEGLVQRVVDGFIGKIGGRRLGGREVGVDLTEWFEMLAFDVLGEMAFGEGFGCVENGASFPPPGFPGVVTAIKLCFVAARLSDSGLTWMGVR